MTLIQCDYSQLSVINENSMSMASDVIHDFVCSPCQEEKLNTEAKYFCRDCSKYYCDQCLTFHSKILKQHAVLGYEDVDKWGGRGDTLISCDLHPRKVIELLCEDHAEMCCQLCVSLKHRMCRSISLISDVAKGIHKMADFKQLPSKVAQVITGLNERGQKEEPMLLEDLWQVHADKDQGPEEETEPAAG
ncbi:LOW QUALITY PROTEIN: hypothetical protein MAR_026121 [Mya arenaria]|uniref:B box-type domain-containing protein n=1 Tax=Mya arenaria TaxID=6604 RepID=A0ABY7ET05_MYAAR|nr:LOW QUALITY PROTEIN: hypothetical protein MAR_026121 [Mya arenaria]